MWLLSRLQRGRMVHMVEEKDSERRGEESPVD